MAHQIFQDRRMFFTGATPWHGLGTALPRNASLDDVRALGRAPPDAVPLPPLAPPPAPAPMPVPVVRFFGPLRAGDWAGLAARVDAGHLTKEEGERIGSEWMAHMQGVSARA